MKNRNHKSKVVFISVHPDDETLGCGGTILKHKDGGDEIYWLIITNIDEENGWDGKFVRRRQKEIDRVSEKYHFSKVVKLDFPTTKLDKIPINNLVKTISKVFDDIKPEIIYLPNRSDIHSDHQISFKAIYSCTKNFRFPYIKKILMYECLSETEFTPALPENVFIPNVFIDVTAFMKRKIEIMKIYQSEIMASPGPRSLVAIESLAKYRGSRVNKDYAEAFCLLFEMR